MLKEYLTNIADVIRSKLGITDTINAQEFSDKIADVYDKGKVDEQFTFWDNFQQQGNKMSYPYAFYTSSWNDLTYNPIYPIIINAGYCVFQDSKITDTKVVIDMSGYTAKAVTIFSRCGSLKKIRKLIVHEALEYDRTFERCTALTDIEIEGTIGKSIDFALSPLSVDSMKSIISHLKDYSLDNTGVYSLVFPDDRWTALETDSVAPDGNTWREYVEYTLGWNT